MKSDHLLSRSDFKELVFKRDKYTCVFCKDKAVDAHHILDRKLFSDGGYYLGNGASVCETHHWEVEKNNISVPDVWKACGITNPKIPDGYDALKEYDKWGNEVISKTKRVPGEMFYEENVQKILKDKLFLFY